MDQSVLLDAIKYGARIAHTEEDWILPLQDAVKAVDYETAKWKPSSELATIWEIVAHAIPYTQSRLHDFTGEPTQAVEDWPNVEGGSEEDWKALQHRVAIVTSKLQQVLADLSEADLGSPCPGKETPRVMRLMDIIVHDAYHAGQVVKMTQLKAAIA